MPANLPRLFFTLQEKLKYAKDNQEKISILEQMLAICPKHKGTEKVQLELRKKIARLKKEETINIQKRKEDIFSFKKEGAGRVIIIGPPNSGKTTIINTLAGTNFKIADFPFTTSLPQSAMMNFENIKIQLIDTPPISEKKIPGWLKNLIQTSELTIVVLEKNDPHLTDQILFFKDILKNNYKTDFVFLINKLSEKEILSLPFLKNENIFLFSFSQKEELKHFIFKKLKIIRIYTKKPNQKPDFFNPFILRKGSTLKDLLKEIRSDGIEKFNFAKLFKKDAKNPLIVGRDYLLNDEDILEIHFRK